MNVENVKPAQVGAVLKQAVEQREISRLEEIAENVASMRI